jgi:HTH-type transcriptional regulator/antitoxin HigA
MSSLALETICNKFAHESANNLLINNEKDYEETLTAIEHLMEKVGESANNPLNPIINMLCHAVEDYENNDTELSEYELNLSKQSDDISLLKVLMEQHNLKLDDLPEIGSKSMISRILSGERKLNKEHISLLSKRFGISPALFF